MFVFEQEGVEFPGAESGIRLAVRGDMVGGLVFGSQLRHRLRRSKDFAQLLMRVLEGGRGSGS